VSTLGEAIGRRARRQAAASSPSAPTAPPAAPPTQLAPAPDSVPAGDLRRRRDALAEQVTELHWDLGGLAYEMAIRDHFRLDVLVRRAASLQERDAELAEVERLLRLEDSASAGSCPGCGAPHSRGATFCWQCGMTLMKRAPSAAEPSHSARQDEHRASTQMMDALLGADRGPARRAAPSSPEPSPFGEQ
jgi:uncharacterized Zn finger protein (UPF0148 family)